MYKINVGDKFYCIKNRDKSNRIHRTGNIYKVSRLNLDYDFIGLNTELNAEFDDGYFYSLINDDKYHYFYDYFISMREYRKEKLKKIENVRKI